MQTLNTIYLITRKIRDFGTFFDKNTFKISYFASSLIHCQIIKWILNTLHS